VELANRHLGLDLVCITELRNDEFVFRAFAWDVASFRVTLDKDGPAKVGFSQLLVEGKIPAVLPDTMADRRVADLPATTFIGIGAFIGISLRFPTGRCVERCAE